MNYDYKKIGERIKKERKLQGMTQEAFAAEYHVKRSTVSKWEHGEAMPNFQTMLDMCAAFDCEMGYLLCEDGYENRTRKTTDTCEVTGLSEEAVNILQNETAHLKRMNAFKDTVRAKSQNSEHYQNKTHTDLQKFISYLIKKCKNEMIPLIADLGAIAEEYEVIRSSEQYEELCSIRDFLKQTCEGRGERKYYEVGEVVKCMEQTSAFFKSKKNCTDNGNEIFRFNSDFVKHVDELIEIAKKRKFIDAEINILNEYKHIKEKEFLVSDSFMDIVKDYIKEGAENGRKDKLQEKR